MHSVLKDSIGSLPPLVGVRPMLMLTGFLGAGKTTLLRAILKELSDREHLADVILNDRENAQIDRETLCENAASVAALTGSCVCCEGLDELCSMILKAAKSSHSLLLIELNGTADPLPLQESFTLLESRFRLHPRWQVCVIDARSFGKRGYYNDLERLQLETASHFFISHTSSLTVESEKELTQAVKEINPQATRATAVTLADALSGAVRHNRGHALIQRMKVKQDDSSSRAFHSALPKPHLHERHQLAHEFTGCNIIFPAAIDSSRIIDWLEALPASVMRAKALILTTSDSKRRYLYERVGLDISPRSIPVPNIDTIPCSGLFIGPDLQPEAILELTRSILHPDCHFSQ